MQCYTELTPPTAVTHSLTLSLLSSTSHNLVIAKYSLIQIFTYKTISAEIDTSANDIGADRDVTDRRLLDNEGFEQSFLGADLPFSAPNELTRRSSFLSANIPYRAQLHL